MMRGKKIFPFSAIVGQDMLKLSLILNAIDPLLGGVLAIGDKGTGKTTLIRSLAKLMGNDAPFVNLPIGVSEDRMVGHVDIEELINAKKETVIPGLMARANEGVLYADEINLLQDYLTDLLLDASAQGSYYLEREGVSKQFDSRFILIGSMNPEEGALRPQLKDRFGLSVNIETVMDAKLRGQIAKSRLAFDDNPDELIQAFAEKDQALVNSIKAAQNQLPAVNINDGCIAHAANLAIQHQVEGHRAEVVLLKAARANAAFNKKKAVSIEDIDKVAPLVMNHRSTNAQASSAPQNLQQKNNEPKLLESDPELQERYLEASDPQNAFKNRVVQKKVRSADQYFKTDNSGDVQSIDLKRSVGQYLAMDKFEIKQKRKSPELKEHHIFLLDSSGSMLKNKIIAYAKGAVNKLAKTSKKQSSSFSVISLFAGEAQIVLKRSAILLEVEGVLEGIKTGGKTNLPAGFKQVKQLISDADLTHCLHVISDGKLNEGMQLDDVVIAYETYCKGIANCHIVDAENEVVKIGIAPELATHINASYELLQTADE